MEKERKKEEKGKSFYRLMKCERGGRERQKSKRKEGRGGEDGQRR